MPDKPVMEPVVVPAGKCMDCPWDGDSWCGHVENHGDRYTGERRPGSCLLGTQDAVRWTPEVVDVVWDDPPRPLTPDFVAKVMAYSRDKAAADPWEAVAAECPRNELAAPHRAGRLVHYQTGYEVRCTGHPTEIAAFDVALRRTSAQVHADKWKGSPDPDPTVEVPRDGLLPCPFCGSDADVDNEPGIPGYYHAFCGRDFCRAEGPTRLGREAAIKAWNERATGGK